MDQVNQDVKTDTTPVAEVKQQPVEQNVKQEVESVPYARFAETTKAKKVLEEKVAQYESQAEDQRQKELEKKGEYETLLTEARSKLEKAEAKAVQYDEYVNGRREAILSTYSDEERDIIGDLALSKLEKYHERQQISKPKVGVDNTRGGSTVAPPPADFHQMSDEDLKDPNKWQAYLNKFTKR